MCKRKKYILNEEQQEELTGMLYKCLLQIRLSAREGNAPFADLLADAFHNLPRAIFSQDLIDIEWFRYRLEDYAQKYNRIELFRNFLGTFDSICPGVRRI